MRVFELMRNLKLIEENATAYSLMTDLRVTRSKALQLLFDYDIRRRGGNDEELNVQLKSDISKLKFVKDGSWVILDIENPLLLAHLKNLVREVGHVSDSSFSSSIVRLSAEALIDVVRKFSTEDENNEFDNNLKERLIKIKACSDSSVPGILKACLIGIGKKAVGEAAEDVFGLVSDLFSRSEDDVANVIKQFMPVDVE